MLCRALQGFAGLCRYLPSILFVILRQAPKRGINSGWSAVRVSVRSFFPSPLPQSSSDDGSWFLGEERKRTNQRCEFGLDPIMRRPHWGQAGARLGPVGTLRRHDPDWGPAVFCGPGRPQRRWFAHRPAWDATRCAPTPPLSLLSTSKHC